MNNKGEPAGCRLSPATNEGTPEMIFGNTVLWVTLVVTAATMAAYAPGLFRNQNHLIRYARWGVMASAAGLLIGLGTLWTLILTHQFQFSYVFRYSSLDMPFPYLVSSLWGGQEGTFLLWASFAGILSVFLRFKAKQYESAVQFFYLGITLFLLLMLTKASPFQLLGRTPLDGNGLNPLLQDPWMTIHPPITFFGFAALGIPAAYAMAALVKEDWDRWIPRALPWTVFGVLSLGAGLLLGGYWSYSILGWGGFWGWDPVENSSLVPWLFGVALIHTQLAQIRRGKFRRLNLVLSILPFLFLTYSTFLTRSGVLADFSVHSFTDLGINQYLVAFMTVFLGGSLLLTAIKFRRIPGAAEPSGALSRETFLLWGGMAFAGFGLFVSLLNSAPILSRIWGGSGTFGPEIYNAWGLPFLIVVCLLMAVAPYLLWGRFHAQDLWTRVRWPLLGGLVAAPLFWVAGLRTPSHLALAVAAALTVFTGLRVAATILRSRPLESGAPITHLGMGLMALGILASTAYDRTELLELPVNREVEALGYTLEYLGPRPIEDGAKDAYDIRVRRGNESATLSPVMFYSDFNGGMMKKPAIRSRLTHDIYISPGGVIEKDPLEAVRQSLVLAKGEMQTIWGMNLTFERFILPGEGSEAAPHGHGGEGDGGMDFGALLKAERDGVVHELRPAFHGPDHRHPETIPGSGYTATVEAIDATNGKIRLAVGKPALVLRPHETGEFEGYSVHLDRFVVDQGGNGNRTQVVAHAQVRHGEATSAASPAIVYRANMEPDYIGSPLGSTGMDLVLAGVDAATGAASFLVAPHVEEPIWVEASTKPFILVLWIGTALIVLGLGVSTVFRGRVAGRVPGSLGVRSGAGGKRRAA
jgi:cytochrome c-type biogenesis protein CcmF